MSHNTGAVNGIFMLKTKFSKIIEAAAKYLFSFSFPLLLDFFCPFSHPEGNVFYPTPVRTKF